MTKKRWIRLLAFVLALIMPIATASVVFAEDEEPATMAYSTETAYKSPDVNTLSGHGEEPEELSVSAGAEYLEKAWYEYVPYSEKAICSYRLGDDCRLLFYDPYTYTNTMVMDVQFDATTTEFDTMSAYTISHTTEKTLSACTSSTDTYTSAEQTSGRDETHSEVGNTGSTTTTYNHSLVESTSGEKDEVSENEYVQKSWVTSSFTLEETNEFKTGLDGGYTLGVNLSGTDNFESGWFVDKVHNKTIYSDDYKTTTSTEGHDDVEYNTHSTTDGWTQLAARVTKTIGSSASTSRSWSETEGTTVTKTYAATHFASDGITPLPWAIVHYTVQMPMKCCVQIKHSGEWITVSTHYFMLTTVKGTCRAWMQNAQVYYEDWGNGEPVVATDFWSQFLTKDQLIKAYSDKLYPVGGAD